MKLWQCKAFCSLIVWSTLTSVFAQDGFTVPIGSQSGLKIKAVSIQSNGAPLSDRKKRIFPQLLPSGIVAPPKLFSQCCM